MAEEPREVTPEQLVEAIRQMKVSDLLVSTIATVGQLGYAKLDPDARDLDQVRLAIEALKALVPVLEGAVEEQSIRDYNQLIANLQLAYASAVSEKPAETPPPDEEPSAEEEPKEESSTGK
jgi:ribosomal protein L12E/L44/L45/RPP1/RPP2